MALTITIPGGPVQLSDTRVKVTVNTDLVQGSLYNVLLKVSNAGGELDGLPQILEGAPDSSGNFVFDISGLLRRNFLPSFHISAGTVCTERSTIPYKVELDIGESYIDSSNVRQENWAELTGSQYQIIILRGGLSAHQENIYNQLSSNFYLDYIVGGKWLTDLPDPVFTAPDKMVKLWYMTAQATAQSLTLEVSYLLKDGSSGTTTVACTINPGSLYEFNVDPVTLGLTVSGSNPVVSYSVTLLNGNTPVVDDFNIHIDHKHYQENYLLFFMNKFSGIDTLWLHGQCDNNLQASHEIASRTPEVTDNSFSSTRVVVAKSGRRQWNINTGYKKYTEIMALQSLILSRQLWLLDGNYVVPVNIEKSDELLARPEDDLHNYTITITEAHENNYL
jgi:hypothetical protein